MRADRRIRDEHRGGSNHIPCPASTLPSTRRVVSGRDPATTRDSTHTPAPWPIGRGGRPTTARPPRIQGPQRRWFAVALTVGLAAAACDRAAPGPRPAIAVTVLELDQAVAPDGSRYAGRVEPISTVQVRSQVDGAVESLAMIPPKGPNGHPLQEGDRVEAGQFLVQLERDTYEQRLGVEQAKLDSAQVQMANQKKEFDRAKGLYQGGVESKEFLDNARTAFDAAKASVAQQEHAVNEARIHLDHTRVTASISGVVLTLAVQPGDDARPQSLLLEIGDVSRVYVTFGVPSNAVAALEIGTLLHMTIDEMGDRDFAGRIERIAPAADERSGVFDVTVALPNPDGALRPGFVAEVRVPRELALASGAIHPLIPLDAVVRPPGDPAAFGVYVVESTPSATSPPGSGFEGTARIRTVDLGGPIGNRVAVRSGLQGDERVIVRGSTLVHDGAAVRVIP
jgi:RND family efflux transporter MFP subunit